MICQRIGLSLIESKIPLHIFLFLRPVQREVFPSALKWVGFFCDHVSEFPFPDMKKNFILSSSTRLWLFVSANCLRGALNTTISELFNTYIVLATQVIYCICRKISLKKENITDRYFRKLIPQEIDLVQTQILKQVNLIHHILFIELFNFRAFL